MENDKEETIQVEAPLFEGESLYEAPMFQLVEEGEEYYFPKARLEVRCRKEKFGYLITVAGYRPLIVNDTYVRILQLCDGNMSIKDIAEQFSQEHGVPLDEVINDVKDAIDQLGRYGYLEETAPGGQLDGHVAGASTP